MNAKTKKIFFRVLEAIGVAVFWIAVWFLLSLSVNSKFLLPSPSDTLVALGALVSDVEFFLIAAITLGRIVLGVLISFAIGILLAVVTENSKIAKALLSPALTVIKSTPVASFIILALLWLDRNLLPLFITSLIVVPIVWSNVSEGIRSVDKRLLEMAEVYRFSRLKRVTVLYVPSVAPYFLAACKSTLGLAWKAGISAEILCTPKRAIGTELYFSKTYLETPELFAWSLVIIVLSIIIEKLFVLAISKLGSKLRILR